MTKYREILRLSNLGLSQQSIADSCGVSKKTVNRVTSRKPRRKTFSGRLMQTIPMLRLQKSYSHLRTNPSHPISGCPTLLTSARNFCVMA